MKTTKRVVAVTGTYEQNGQTKKRYTNVGTLFTREDGSLSLKMDAVPVAPWDGWLAFYDFNKKD